MGDISFDESGGIGGDALPGGDTDFSAGGTEGSLNTAMGAPDTASPTSSSLSSILGGTSQAGGSIGQLATSLIYGGKQLAMAKKQRNIEDALRTHKYQNSMYDSLDQEGQAIKNYQMGTSEAEGQLAGRGLESSSIRNNTLSNMAFQQQTHLNAIQRSRALLTHGYDAENQLRDLQWSAMKMQRQEAVVGAAIGTATDLAKMAAMA